ncbi:hypothetical protein G5V65_12040 [Rhodobacter sp. HX-7-19]|uniref:Uncharacterized protein n=1 Tax=Paragemmobacter kunshanensis TaxID=2583234 RepID=A0A6M1TNI0_9RHOB|nr:hypothetical protein [Rhodobacter kunshanensis]NGQ91629.1 hypothetical protein [Rhodobacter kunshanensis]
MFDPALTRSMVAFARNIVAHARGFTKSSFASFANRVTNTPKIGDQGTIREQAWHRPARPNKGELS